MAKSASEKGYCFALYDQEGFGKSAPTTTRVIGLIKSWEHLISDAQEFIEHVLQTEENLEHLPFFSLGISMGGSVCLWLSLKVQGKGGVWKNYKGTVLLAPAIDNSLEPHWIVIKLLVVINWLGGYWLRWGPTATDTSWKEMKPDVPEELWPWRGEKCLQSQMEMKTSILSSYPSRMMLGTGYQLLHMTRNLQRNLEKIKIPFYCAHGMADAVIPVTSSSKLHLLASSTDKTLQTINHLCHSMFDDPLWPKIEEDIWKWITQRI